MKRAHGCLYVFTGVLFLFLTGCSAIHSGGSSVSDATGADAHAGHGVALSSPQGADAAHAGDHGGDERMKMMHGHMGKMKERMEKIKASEDPEERRRLMKEHAADMKKCMEMMKTMPGCKMEKAGDDKGGMDMKTMAACQQNMAMKMDMMELVVEGTLESLKMEK